MGKRASPSELRLRIVWLHPVAGVAHAVQVGRAGLLTASFANEERLEFEFSVRVGARVAGEPPNFLGPCTQGPRGGRFVYVNSGQSAGLHDTPWSRRAKIHLASITWSLIEAVQAKRGAVLEAHIHGISRDGGPACATVPFVKTWHVASGTRAR
jgi:hypothetical protein